MDGERGAKLREAIGIDGADQLLALALRVDQPRVGELLHVVRHRRCAQLEPTDELREEAVVDAALREIELALLEEVHEQPQAVRVRERPEHPRELVEVRLRHARLIRMLSNYVNGSLASARYSAGCSGAPSWPSRTRGRAAA